MSASPEKLTTPQPPAAVIPAIEDSPDLSSLPDREIDYVDQELNREIKRARLKTLQDNNVQRKKYATNTFILTCCWIGIVIIIVVFAGIKKLALSDTVLITLITTTTASVFGFFLLVMKYLFNPEFEKSVNNNDKPA